MKGFRAWCEVVKEEKKYFEEYRRYARKIKKIAESEIGDVEVQLLKGRQLQKAILTF